MVLYVRTTPYTYKTVLYVLGQCGQIFLSNGVNDNLGD